MPKKQKKQKNLETRFFHYSQNNSGGSFVHDPKRGISHHVIIEAANAEEADIRAESIGLYFDGCETGQDCGWCGDRWYRAYGPGSTKPEKYGKEIAPNSSWEKGTDFSIRWIKEGPVGFIHYLDGSVVPFGI